MFKFFIGLLVAAALSCSVQGTFFFQDDTLTNSLRVCNETSCENLANSNSSTLNNITSVYETGGSRLNPDINAFTFSNIWFIVGAVVLLGMVVIFWRYMRRG